MLPLFSDVSLTLALPPHLARKNKAFLTTAPKDKPVRKSMAIASLVDARFPFSPHLLKIPESTSSLALPTTELSTSAATSSPITTTTSLSRATLGLHPRQTRKAWASNGKDSDAFSQQPTVSMNISEDTAARQVSGTNHQLKPKTVMGQAIKSSLRKRAWSRNIKKSVENHPRSKVLREAWKRRTLDAQPESSSQIGIYNGLLLDAGVEGMSEVEPPEPTTTGITSSSEATAESASTSAIPLVGAQHQTAGAL